MIHIKVFALVALLVLELGVVASAQPAPSAQQPTQDYEQRVTKALETAKKSADDLNKRHATLLDALHHAADPQQAQKVLDDLISSATSAVDGFKEHGEVMQAVDALLSYIDVHRKNAEHELEKDPKWKERVNSWNAHNENFRQLRQALLQEADRAQRSLDKLKEERKFIEDVIAGEGVEKARAEMENALRDLKVLGDSLDAAVKEAQQREKSVPAF